jgi:hypothetical protein
MLQAYKYKVTTPGTVKKVSSGAVGHELFHQGVQGIQSLRGNLEL